MEHNNEFWVVLMTLLAVSAFITASFRRANLNPILGLVAAGVTLGPAGFSIIESGGGLDFLAELGIMFLLFVVGLELSLSRIKSMSKYIFGLGLLHFTFSVVAFFFIIYFIFEFEEKISIVLAAALSMSSTAFVLQILGEKKALKTNNGRMTFSVLLFQDIMVAPLLAIVPMLAINHAIEVNEHQSVSMSFIPAIISMVIIFIMARLFLEQILKAIHLSAKPDGFPSAVLLTAMGMGWASMQFGLSASLGAFLAGLALSDADWRREVKTTIAPFEHTLLAFFFISIGIKIPFNEGIVDVVLPMIGIAFLIILVKFITGFLAAIIVKLKLKKAIQLSLTLSQAGEFSFMLIAVAANIGIINKEISSIWIGSAVISMIVTPLLINLGDYIAKDIVDLEEESKENIDEDNK